MKHSQIADKFGRRKFAILYCLIYFGHCATKHWSFFKVLMIGRILGGISTSLLGCSFESWMVTQHKASGYSDELLEQTFAQASFINGLLAVAAGFECCADTAAAGTRHQPC